MNVLNKINFKTLEHFFVSKDFGDSCDESILFLGRVENKNGFIGYRESCLFNATLTL